MDQDQFAHIRDSENVYYPFASKSEWEFANWLSSGSLSQKEINLYLHSQYVGAYLSDAERLLTSEQNKEHPVSFRTAKDLRARIESLPDIPRWRSQEIKVGPYSTKSPLVLYWRDGLEVVKHLFSNPVFASCIDFDPYREYEKASDGHQERVYGEFMSADHAWEIQVRSASQVVQLY